MTDGHTGVENQEINRGGSDNFPLILSCLKERSEIRYFVIHATSPSLYPKPFEFLKKIGFTRFEETCPFHNDQCFYREIATIQVDAYSSENRQQVESIHNAFNRFAEKIDELFSLYQKEDQILGEIGIEKNSVSVFSAPYRFKVKETDIPLWIEDIKPKRLRILEKQSAKIQTDIYDLQGFLPLVYATGDILVEVVLKALQFMGLEAELTQPSFTADILAQTRDSTKHFCFEVTGTEGAIKKDSKKLTQVLEFERIKEHDEKTVLLANTFRNLPIKKRKNREHFTPQVIDFLSRHPILLMTGYELYRMICDILEGKKNPEDIINLIFYAEGRLEY